MNTAVMCLHRGITVYRLITVMENVDQFVRGGFPARCTTLMVVYLTLEIVKDLLPHKGLQHLGDCRSQRNGPQVFRNFDWRLIVLGTGTTSSCFQAEGTIPWRTEKLNMAHKGSASHTEKSRKNQLGTSSGPHAL